jgi:Hypothetical glycosyl hydrolase family 15
MRRSAAGLCALAALALSVPSARADAPAAVGTVRVAIDSTPDFSNIAADKRDNVVILQSWQTAKLHQLKAANPNVTVLMYKNSSAATSAVNTDGTMSAGVAKTTAVSHGWLLKNKSGAPFTFQGFSWLWAADIGAKGYQDAWAANVTAALKSDEWDGVFMDDVNPTLRYHYSVGQVAKYPSDAAYSAATKSFLAEVGPQIKAAGELAIPNMGSWSDYSGVVTSWLPYVSGGMDEMFTKWGDKPGVGYRDEAGWQRQLDEVKATAAQGKLFLGISHSSAGDRAAARYGFATALLGGNGKTEFDLSADYTHQTWFPEYNVDLGAPRGAEHPNAKGVHVRSFAHGLVVVNPTAATHSVAFGGSYAAPGAAPARNATLAPHSALVLKRASGSPATTQSQSAAPVRALPRAALVRALPRVALSRHLIRLRVTCAHSSHCHVRLRLSTMGLASGRRAGTSALHTVSTRTLSIHRHSRVVSFRLPRGMRAGRKMAVLGATHRVHVSPRHFVLGR